MGTYRVTNFPVWPVFSRMWWVSNRDISEILLNSGAISLKCSAFGRWHSLPPVPDAGSCNGGCDRHQLSMPNYYSKEKADAGQRTNTDKSRDTNAWHRLLSIKYRGQGNASCTLNEYEDQSWGFEDKAIIDPIAQLSRVSPKLIMFKCLIGWKWDISF